MLNLFLLTRLLDILSTSYGFYIFKLNELNFFNRYLLNQGLFVFSLWQVSLSFLLYKLAKRYRLIYIVVVLFTLLSIPFIFINILLIFLS